MKPSNLLNCWNCGKTLADVPLPISRHAHCTSCFEVLRCCRMCQHYRDLDHTKCAEDRADPPVIKENANFCEFFRPDRNAFNPNVTQANGAAKSRLDALFGDALSGGDKEVELADDMPENNVPKRSALDDLFDD
ncbi:MAG: hypothetical protein HOG25_17225 [Gammaproteobacteria bacterium]|jgi:hypothetical protein|nr:hypothetical protein [Gammaproteobacteria bacterium]